MDVWEKEMDIFISCPTKLLETFSMPHWTRESTCSQKWTLWTIVLAMWLLCGKIWHLCLVGRATTALTLLLLKWIMFIFSSASCILSLNMAQYAIYIIQSNLNKLPRIQFVRFRSDCMTDWLLSDFGRSQWLSPLFNGKRKSRSDNQPRSWFQEADLI